MKQATVLVEKDLVGLASAHLMRYTAVVIIYCAPECLAGQLMGLTN